MNDYSLYCNIPKCKIPLNETAWVTRCMHLFCPGHGQAYFSNPSPQISCPICNEINLKEVDILHCEVNPSDMILAGITPEKAIHLAAKAIKFWSFQMQQQKCLNNSNIIHLVKQNSYMKHNYNKMLNKIKQKYETEIDALKNGRHNLLKQIENINIELERTEKELHKYKNVYSSRNEASDNVFRSSLSPHWFTDDNSPQIPRKSNRRSSVFLQCLRTMRCVLLQHTDTMDFHI